MFYIVFLIFSTHVSGLCPVRSFRPLCTCFDVAFTVGPIMVYHVCMYVCMYNLNPLPVWWIVVLLTQLGFNSFSPTYFFIWFRAED